jgi:hypothetical protein
MKNEQSKLDWRRSKVLELSSQGYSQRDIAKSLQIGLGTVNKDLLFLRQQARENLQYHIHDRIPEEYQNFMTGLKRIIKLTTEIADTAIDPRTKLQAFVQLTDGYKYIMELTTGGVIITDAIKYAQGQMNHFNKTEKALLQNIQEKKNGEQPEDIEQQPTTNGVF